MSDDFPAEIKRFVEQHIESLAQLEALLLLHQDPKRAWRAAEMAKLLYIPQELGELLLADLATRRFATGALPPETQFSYLSTNTEMDKLIDELALLYRDRRVAVISLIYSKPLNKVQTFADAFRLRKEP
jgi:hypothetical protein